VNTSDGGLLLLGKLQQRIFGIIQGYEDLNDHEQFHYDPLLQYVCESQKLLAGKSTLNRLELGKEPDDLQGNRYTKIT